MYVVILESSCFFLITMLYLLVDKVMEDELADYNGDDENEGEPEADKQAELGQI